MSKSEQTRQFIIEKAASLFNLKGYDSTSLTDVQLATGLTKGAIYGNFADKNELAIAAFEYNSSSIHSRIKSLMDEQATAGAALSAFTNFYAENCQVIFQTGGCPLMNATIEADDHLDFLKKSVKKSMNSMLKSLQLIIEKGQQNKEFRKVASSEQYAATIFMTIEGGILLAKAMNDPKYIKLAIARINLIVDKELKV